MENDENNKEVETKIENNENKEEELPEQEVTAPPPKKKRNWLGFVVIVLIILLVCYSLSRFDNSRQTELTEEEVATLGIDFVNNHLLAGSGQTAVLTDVYEEDGVYALYMKISGQDYISYISKNGKLLFPTGINTNITTNAAVERQNITKTTTPEVELFIMSYCPYGTQIEKGMIPVMELLGDKADIQIKFVYYAMHGEIEVKEQLLQYCINKEQPEKYLPYLKCFLEAGDSGNCLGDIDVSQCVIDTNNEFRVIKNLEDEDSYLSGAYPLFDIHKEDNIKYDVGGSPTLIINGVQVSVDRDSQSLLNAICNGFIEQPDECITKLSTITPSPGFGYGEGDENTATCN